MVTVLPAMTLSVAPAAVERALHLREAGAAEALLAEGLALARPQAVYRVGYVEEREPEGVVVDGRRFVSRVLRRQLDRVERVFVAVVTLGGGLEAAVDRREDLLAKYNLDVVGNLLLDAARSRLSEHLRARFGLEKLSWMSPGSLDDWPLAEQRPLFDLLEGGAGSIGVRLTEHLLMLPRKSVSGIFFPSETPFFSCRLCPRERCPGRKARYDEALARDWGLS